MTKSHSSQSAHAPSKKTKGGTEHVKSKRPWLKALGITALVISVSSAAVLSASWLLLSAYENRMVPQLSVAGINIGGKTLEEAKTMLEEHANAMLNTGIAVEYTAAENQSITVDVTPEIVPLSASGDIQTIYTINTDATLNSAYEIGREEGKLKRLFVLSRSLIMPAQKELVYTVQSDALKQLLHDGLSLYETPPVNAAIRIEDDLAIQIIPDVSGVTFDYDAIERQIAERIASLSNEHIVVHTQETAAAVRSADIESKRTLIESYLSRAPLTFTWENKTWSITAATIGSWLGANADGVYVDSDQLYASIEDIREVVETTPIEGRWALEKDAGGAPTGIHEITPSRNGRSIDSEAMADAVLAALSDQASTTIALVTQEQKTAFAQANASGLQIKDILGTGHSNMAGSPTNRRKNIARGVELLNGLLIPPGERFSLVQSLKPFTLENGYFPELVIKGNKTEPEIGGGLCQVGTTTFRGAMSAGLNIVQRSNHAYAVSYYTDDRNNQPGTDATIYDPSPDFVFENDTPGYILLQTRIEGNDLYFDFWGTSDGRKASFSAPRTYNWVAPPPMKEILTTDLAPGQRKCTESAHAGITADFTYTIEQPDGTIKERVFTSKYRPWQAVCLVGAPATPASETPTNTSAE